MRICPPWMSGGHGTRCTDEHSQASGRAVANLPIDRDYVLVVRVTSSQAQCQVVRFRARVDKKANGQLFGKVGCQAFGVDDQIVVQVSTVGVKT